MMGMKHFLAALLLMLPLPVLAQDWQFSQSDDGVVFSAQIQSPGGSAFSLMCAGRTPQAPAVLPVYYESTIRTKPDVLHLVLDDRLFNRSIVSDKRDNMLIVFANSAYRLPQIGWDDYISEWSTSIQATGAMFDAISASASFELHSDVGVLKVSSAGFAAAYANLLNTCRSRFAAIGRPWQTLAAVAPVSAPPAQSGQSMLRAAEAFVWQGCEGSYTAEPDAFLTGNIDGDGVPDVVIDWGSIHCSGAMARPFCGASQCSADVFLSQLFPVRQQPEQMLGQSVGLVALSNGNMGVGVSGSLSTCSQMPGNVCGFLYYWNGVDFVELP